MHPGLYAEVFCSKLTCEAVGWALPASSALPSVEGMAVGILLHTRDGVGVVLLDWTWCSAQCLATFACSAWVWLFPLWHTPCSVLCGGWHDYWCLAQCFTVPFLLGLVNLYTSRDNKGVYVSPIGECNHEAQFIKLEVSSDETPVL